MTENNVKLGLNDISILPCVISDINSRSECIPYDEYGMLPLFTAPMNTVIDNDNYSLYEDNKITPIIPRTVSLGLRVKLLEKGKWVAFGLEEINNLFIEKSDKPQLLCSDNIDYEETDWLSKINIDNLFKFDISTLIGKELKILIDVANGHMKQLYDIHKELKKRYKCIVMLGNVANPETYRFCCEQGVDYVRIGIGGGSGCITSSNTGIHYPMATLIEECYNISCTFDNPTKIVADGGMKNYSDIIKALALGADYVMCGGLFAKMLETPGKVKFKRENFVRDVDQYIIDFSCLEEGEYLEKQFYGMASKIAQKQLGNNKLKTSEGKVKTITIEYTMSGWVENFTHYLKSAMSYCGKRDLKDFIGNVNIVKISNNASNAFNK